MAWPGRLIAFNSEVMIKEENPKRAVYPIPKLKDCSKIALKLTFVQDFKMFHDKSCAFIYCIVQILNACHNYTQAIYLCKKKLIQFKAQRKKQSTK